ncbi:MAG: class I SAM-dependent methyltransferase [Planctomycetota bacterium]
MPTPITTVDIDCPLCGAREYRAVATAVDHTYDVPGQYSIVRCKACSHLYLNPRPADDCLLACYPDDYAPYVESNFEVAPASVDSKMRDKASFDDPAEKTPQQALAKGAQSNAAKRRSGVRAGLGRFLRWLWDEHAIVIPAPPLAGQSQMLEIGCAHGGFLAAAQEQGWSVEGVEPSSVAAKAAREKGLPVTHGFLDDYAGEPESLDWVALWMVLEHVPNPNELTMQIAGLLKPGGVVTLSIPNAATWERFLFRGNWLGYDAPRHLQDFTPDTIRHLLESHGFRNVQIRHQSNTRYWFGSLACWGRTRFPKARWPEKWMDYFRNEPPRSWSWLLLIPGKVNALLELSGRITVTATKR